MQNGDAPYIHDKRETFHWSEEYGPDRFERVFDANDVIVSLDPQERLGEGTLLVSEVTDRGQDITQRGLFWKSDEAFRYANSLRDQGHPGTDAVI